jgi:uncharacterized membrane protein
MAELYTTMKWLHVVSACVAFGSNVTHLFWLFSANAIPAGRAEKLRVVKKIDDRLAVPAYVVTIGCGATMWFLTWPTNTPWIIVSLVLSIILTVMGISFGPFMKKWIRLADESSTGNPQLLNLSRRLTAWWAFIAASVVIILYLMVWKPTLW